MRAEGASDRERAEAAKAVVAQAFGWRRIEEVGPREFYARDQQGRALWLKARSKPHGRENVSWDWTHDQPQYDLFVGIIVEEDGEISTVIQAPRALVERLKRITQDSYRLRWNDETKAAVEYLWRSDK